MVHDIISSLWNVCHLKLLSFTRGEGGWDTWLKKPMLDPHTRHKFTKLFFVMLWQKYIRGMLGVEPLELSAEDEEWQTLINETTYSKTDDRKWNSRWQYGISSASQICCRSHLTHDWRRYCTEKKLRYQDQDFPNYVYCLYTFWGWMPSEVPKLLFKLPKGTIMSTSVHFILKFPPLGFFSAWSCFTAFYRLVVSEEITWN